jgi:hypothetical protein
MKRRTLKKRRARWERWWRIWVKRVNGNARLRSLASECMAMFGQASGTR